jgi:Protein of unknown function (DUF3592)
MAAHDFEPELDQPTPRPVWYRNGAVQGCGQWFLRLFILPHTLAGVGLVVATVCAIVMHVAILFVGTEVDGRIVGKIEEPGEDRRQHSLEYTFQLDGDDYRSQARVDAEDYPAAKVGDPISVRTLRWFPEIAHWPRVPGYSPLLTVAGLLCFSVFWNGLLSVFAWRAYLRPWRHWRLVRYGRPARGIVRRVERRVSEGPATVRVHYAYTTPPGDKPTRVVAGSMSGSGPEADAIEVGSVVTVLYLPRKPRRSLLYRFAAYRAAAPRA